MGNTLLVHLRQEMGSRCDDDDDDDDGGGTRFAILTELFQCIMSNALLVPVPSSIQRGAMYTQGSLILNSPPI